MGQDQPRLYPAGTRSTFLIFSLSFEVCVSPPSAGGGNGNKAERMLMLAELDPGSNGAGRSHSALATVAPLSGLSGQNRRDIGYGASRPLLVNSGKTLAFTRQRRRHRSRGITGRG